LSICLRLGREEERVKHGKTLIAKLRPKSVLTLAFNAAGDAGDAAIALLLFSFCQGAYSAPNPSLTNHKSNDITVLLFQ
jgi:hypothetical protein